MFAICEQLIAGMIMVLIVRIKQYLEWSRLENCKGSQIQDALLLSQLLLSVILWYCHDEHCDNWNDDDIDDPAKMYDNDVDLLSHLF